MSQIRPSMRFLISIVMYKGASQGSLEQFLQPEFEAGGSKLWFCMAIFSPLPSATFLNCKLKNTAQLQQEPGI